MSHDSKDKRFVRRLSKDLRAFGHEPWLDEWEIKVGECVTSKIGEAINVSDYVIVVLTPDSVASGWVDREWKTLYWSEIQEADIKVLPVLLRKCDIPPLLRSKKYADFTSEYEVGLRQLIESLSSDATGISVKNTLNNDSSVRFRELTPRMLKLRFEFVAAGRLLEVEVPANLLVLELMRTVIKEMRFSRELYGGGDSAPWTLIDDRVAIPHLYSKTRAVELNNSSTLEDNGVEDGETLHLKFTVLAI